MASRSIAGVKRWPHYLRDVVTPVDPGDEVRAELGQVVDGPEVVSVRRRGAGALGTRTEIKNLNSMRYARRAIAYEVKRQVDLIESGGYRVGPGEIEACLMSHEAVEHVCVLGVPDAVRGQIVKAFIVTRKDILVDERLEASIREHVRQKLEKHIEGETVFLANYADGLTNLYLLLLLGSPSPT